MPVLSCRSSQRSQGWCHASAHVGPNAWAHPVMPAGDGGPDRLPGWQPGPTMALAPTQGQTTSGSACLLDLGISADSFSALGVIAHQSKSQFILHRKLKLGFHPPLTLNSYSVHHRYGSSWLCDFSLLVDPVAGCWQSTLSGSGDVWAPWSPWCPSDPTSPIRLGWRLLPTPYPDFPTSAGAAFRLFCLLCVFHCLYPLLFLPRVGLVLL